MFIAIFRIILVPMVALIFPPFTPDPVETIRLFKRAVITYITKMHKPNIQRPRIDLYLPLGRCRNVNKARTGLKRERPNVLNRKAFRV